MDRPPSEGDGVPDADVDAVVAGLKVRGRRSARWRTAVVGGLVFAAAVLVATARLNLVTDEASELLHIEPIAFEPHVPQFALPLDAPLEEFPYQQEFGCTRKLLMWLREHGDQRPAFVVRIENTTSDGRAVVVDNVHIDKMKAERPPPRILFQCLTTSGDGTQAPLQMVLQRDHPAVVNRSSRAEPFSLHLEAGEMRTLRLFAPDPKFSYSGQIVADVSIGDETSRVHVTPPGGDKNFSIGGFGGSSGLVVSPIGPVTRRCPKLAKRSLTACAVSPAPRGTFHCWEATQPEPVFCTPPRIRAIVARLEERQDIAAGAAQKVSDQVDCSDARKDAAGWQAVWSGFFEGALPGEGQQGHDAVVADPIRSLRRRCGSTYATQVLGSLGMSEADMRVVARVMNPGSTAPDDSDGTDSAAALVERSSCSDAAGDAQRLGRVWSGSLGGSWVSHPDFDTLAYRPMQRLRQRCGTRYAVDVVDALGLVGASYRALDQAARGGG